MISRSFYFLRHGETDWNKEERLQGWSDRPLNDTGRRQAHEILPVLKNLPIDLIVSSSLVRAQHTAEIVNQALQKPFDVDELLRERHFGDWEGLNLDEIRNLRTQSAKTAPDHVEENGYPPPPGGEKYADFKTRTLTGIERHLNKHQTKNILFVLHGGIFRALRLMMFNDQQASGNVEPWFFEKLEKGWAAHRLRG